jgi:periplasmic protein TonB
MMLHVARMNLYYTIVGLLNKSYVRFFGVSIAVHVVLLFVVYPAPPIRRSEPETISVSLLEREPQALMRVPRTPPTRAANTPAIIARKNSLPAPAKTDAARARDRRKAEPEIIARADPTPPPQPAPAPVPHEIIPEQSVVAERPLPTVKELLPPIGWSSSSRSNAPVSLNTRDPGYVTYFTKLKQLIESQWEYPELAQRYGLQGRLAVEFTIGAHGQLERLRVVRSSGSQLLDEEALRAITAAAPFPPIPSWIKPNPLPIAAAMEYHDSRLNYRFAR